MHTITEHYFVDITGDEKITIQIKDPSNNVLIFDTYNIGTEEGVKSYWQTVDNYGGPVKRPKKPRGI